MESGIWASSSMLEYCTKTLCRKNMPVQSCVIDARNSYARLQCVLSAVAMTDAMCHSYGIALHAVPATVDASRVCICLILPRPPPSQPRLARTVDSAVYFNVIASNARLLHTVLVQFNGTGLKSVSVSRRHIIP